MREASKQVAHVVHKDNEEDNIMSFSILFLPLCGLHIGALIFTWYLLRVFSSTCEKKISISSLSCSATIVVSVLISLYVYGLTTYRLAVFAGFLDYKSVDGFFWPFIPWIFSVSLGICSITIFLLAKYGFEIGLRKELKTRLLVAPIVVVGVCIFFSGYVLANLIKGYDLKERVWSFADRYEEFADSNSQIQRIMAFNIRYQNSVLAKLSKSNDEVTRALVAANRITDDVTLGLLANDNSWLVKAYLLTNPTLSCDVFKKIEQSDTENNIEKLGGIQVSKDEKAEYKYLKIETTAGTVYLKKYSSACVAIKSVRIQKPLYNRGMKYKDIFLVIIPAVMLIIGLTIVFYRIGFFEAVGKGLQTSISIPAFLSFLTAMLGFVAYWLSERMVWIIFVPLYMVFLAPLIYLAVWPIYKLIYLPFDPDFNIRQMRSIAKMVILIVYFCMVSIAFCNWHGMEGDWRYLIQRGRVSERLLDIYNGSKEDIRLRTELARNPNTPPDILNALAETNGDAVAWNINTPDETLRRLSKNKNYYQQLLENPSLPCDTLIKIVNSGKYRILPPRLAEVLGAKINPEDRKKWPLEDRKDKRDVCFRTRGVQK